MAHRTKKTLSFAVVHFTVAFGLSWLLTGSIVIAGALAMLEPLVNTVAFYLHDGYWAKKEKALAGQALS